MSRLTDDSYVSRRLRELKGEAPPSMRELAKQTGIDVYTLHQRWHRGDRGARLTRPVRQRHIRKGQ